MTWEKVACSTLPRPRGLQLHPPRRAGFLFCFVLVWAPPHQPWTCACTELSTLWLTVDALLPPRDWHLDTGSFQVARRESMVLGPEQTWESFATRPPWSRSCHSFKACHDPDPGRGLLWGSGRLGLELPAVLRLAMPPPDSGRGILWGTNQPGLGLPTMWRPVRPFDPGRGLFWGSGWTGIRTACGLEASHDSDPVGGLLMVTFHPIPSVH